MNYLVQLLLLICAVHGCAYAQSAAQLGRSLYMGHAPWTAGTQATTSQLPAQFSACLSCHGANGEGKNEGGQLAPALRWSNLLRSQGTSPAYASAGEVLAAIEQGVGRGGKTLNSAMPRFNLAAPERDALLAYLQILGTAADQPPGVTAQTVRIGVVLPLQGVHADAGQGVLRGLTAVVRNVNLQGGVHGRKLELVVRHAPLDAAQARAVTQDLLDKENIFAMAASFVGDQEQLLRERRISHVAALAQLPETAKLLDGWIAPLLPPAQRESGNNTAQTRLPLPKALLSQASADGATLWRVLGQTAGQVLVEALAQAGPQLHERSLLEALVQLNGKELATGLRLAYSRQHMHAFLSGE